MPVYNPANQSGQLYFPSNAFINFVRPAPCDGLIDPLDYELEDGCNVLPSIQFWSTRNGDFKLVNYENNFQCISNYYRAYPVKKGFVFLFDINKGIIASVLKDDASWEVLVKESKERKTVCDFSFAKSTKNSNGSGCPLSLCVHTDFSNSLCSVVTYQECYSQGLKKSIQQIIFFHHSTHSRSLPFDPMTKMSLIKRHDYMGDGTFLFLAGRQLFFKMYGNDDDHKAFYKQKFYALQGVAENLKNHKKLEIVSFSINHDEDKKTTLGRARFFALLCNTMRGDLKEQAVFLVDLLSPYNTIKRVWSCVDNQEIFDRIAFGCNTVSLWNNDAAASNALKIELPSRWINPFESSLLVAHANKNGQLIKGLQAFELKNKRIEKQLSSLKSRFDELNKKTKKA